MSEVTDGILAMPFELAMGTEVARRQFHGCAMAEIERFKAELECALGDLKTAEGMIGYHRKYSDRYRWLRAQGWSDPAEMWVVIAKTGSPIVHIDLDAAIDAAIAKERS